MPLIEKDKQINVATPTERAAGEIIRLLNDSVARCDRNLSLIRQLVQEHTRAALVTELTNLGETPAELLTVYNAIKSFVQSTSPDRTVEDLP